MAFDQELADRVWELLVPLALAAGAACAKKRMFGSLCFIVDGHISCGVNEDGLLVRVGQGGMDRALTQAHVRPMELGGRQMSGFVIVAPEGCTSATRLQQWVKLGMSAAEVSAR